MVWRPGVIVTVEHGIKREDDLHATLANGEHIRASLAGRDPGPDIAVLKADNIGGGFAGMADDETVRPGAVVLAVGRARKCPPSLWRIFARESSTCGP